MKETVVPNCTLRAGPGAGREVFLRGHSRMALHAMILDANKNCFLFVCMLRLYLFAILLLF